MYNCKKFLQFQNTIVYIFKIRHIEVTISQIIGAAFIGISIILFVFYSQSSESEIEINEGIQRRISNSSQQFSSDVDNNDKKIDKPYLNLNETVEKIHAESKQDKDDIEDYTKF